MAAKTGIPYADSTLNPWRGCTKQGPGCLNCYAERDAKRHGWCEWGPGKPRHRFAGFRKSALALNRKPWVCGSCRLAHSVGWCRVYSDCAGCHGALHRRRVFFSLGDWLDPEVRVEWLAELLQTIHDTQNLWWLLLTKQPKQYRARLLEAGRSTPASAYETVIWIEDWLRGRPPSNVMVGTSVEDQQRADQRIPELLRIPGRRFLSIEPLLGPVDLSRNKGAHDGRGLCWDWAGQPTHIPHGDYPAVGREPGKGPAIGWVIVGGESGPGARPCRIEWIRDIVRQCRAAKVPCFVKQLGEKVLNVGNCPPELLVPEFKPFRHPKGGDPKEWPEDLRVQEWMET